SARALPSLISTIPTPTYIYSLSLHDALPISSHRELLLEESHEHRVHARRHRGAGRVPARSILPHSDERRDRRDRRCARDRWSGRDRKSTRLNSSHVSISYAVFCLKKKREHLS